MFSSGSGASKLALAVVIGLIALKIAVAIFTGSLSILAQAADSLLDVFAVAITFVAVRAAAKPADGEHPFGHGKLENVAAAGQALFIVTAGSLIIYSAARRITQGTAVELTEAGIGVMLVSIIASVLLARHLYRVSRATDSPALEANAENIAADVYSAAAVLVGLVIVRVTRISVIDPIIALLVAFFILRVGYGLLKKSFRQLVDVKLPEAEERVISSSVMKYSNELVGFHKLRTRKSGNQRYIDLHIVVPNETTVEEAHRLCNLLERDIGEQLRHTSVTIHVEPCNEECSQCRVACDARK